MLFPTESSQWSQNIFFTFQIIYRLQVLVCVSEFSGVFTLLNKAIEYCEIYINIYMVLNKTYIYIYISSVL